MGIQVNRFRVIGIALLGMALAACGATPATPDAPTRVSVEALRAETTSDLAATATPPRSARTLPPSWTPMPTRTPTPTALPTLPPTATPPPAAGTILYIYNGDSIAAVDVAPATTRLIVTFGVGQPITDLTLSPDGSLIAYVAPGNGSAREVYVGNLDGTYRQQVSCLGLAEVRAPAWSADGQSLAFLAAALPGQPVDVYAADFAGSNTCPTGNNQRRVLALNSSRVTEVVWQPDKTRLFFNNEEIYALDLNTGSVSPALTETRGFGADFGLAFNPIQPTVLVYMRAERVLATDQEGGLAFQLDVTQVNGLLSQQALPSSLADRVEWSRDGAYLLVSEADTIRVYDMNTRIGQVVANRLTSPPRALFSPDARLIAYRGADPRIPALEQLYVLDWVTGEVRQVSFLTEGTINSVVWAP